MKPVTKTLLVIAIVVIIGCITIDLINWSLRSSPI